MKIDDHLSTSNETRSQSVGRAPEARLEGRQSDSRSEPASDRASLSALSVAISRALEHDPPEQVARIERLREAVNNGTYAVPGAEVASRIVASSLRSEE